MVGRKQQKKKHKLEALAFSALFQVSRVFRQNLWLIGKNKVFFCPNLHKHAKTWGKGSSFEYANFIQTGNSEERGKKVENIKAPTRIFTFRDRPQMQTKPLGVWVFLDHAFCSIILYLILNELVEFDNFVFEQERRSCNWCVRWISLARRRHEDQSPLIYLSTM